MKNRFTPVIILIIFNILPSRSQSVYSLVYFPDNHPFSSFRALSVFSYANEKTSEITLSELSHPRQLVFYPEKNNLVYRWNEVASDTFVYNPGINYTRLALVGGALVTTMTAIHIYQQNGWWKDNRAPFHFKEDFVYGLSVDKVGHFYGADVISFLVRKSLLWANLSDKQALWIGAGGGLLFQTFTEMEDGFSAWGFDRVDWLCNLGGALWAPARHHIPFLGTFDIKMSYHPSDLLGNPGGIGFKGQKHLIIDDYEGQTFWLSMKIEDILPQTLRSTWPDFLCLALGYGARGVATPDPHRVYFIAPDIDFTRLIPQSTPFLKTLGEALNFIHPPLPALRIHPTSIWYGIYF